MRQSRAYLSREHHGNRHKYLAERNDEASRYASVELHMLGDLHQRAFPICDTTISPLVSRDECFILIL
jgi:hypothetical protein